MNAAVQTSPDKTVPTCVLRRLAALRARIGRQFETLDEDVPIGPLRVQFTRVADPQRVLEDLCRRIDAHERATGQRVVGDQLGLPYWAELWDSAIGIGQWLASRRDVWFPQATATETIPHPSPPRVLDLGCGMGLAGTVAALLGAEVLLGDIETACLPFAALNAMKYGGTRASVRRIDWQHDDLGRAFDLIIGSDVLYDKPQWPHVESFVTRHLAPAGRVLLGEPGRISGDLFQPWIRQRGWDLHRESETVPTRSTPIRLFVLTRP